MVTTRDSTILSDTTMTTESPISLNPADRLKTAEAAAFIGLSPNTLTCWRSRKTGPAYIFNGKVALYEVRDLVKWLESRRVTHDQVPL